MLHWDPRLKKLLDQNHQRYASQAFARQHSGQVILEPEYCGTGPETFLPLTYIRSWDPTATVVIFGSFYLSGGFWKRHNVPAERLIFFKTVFSSWVLGPLIWNWSMTGLTLEGC